MVKSLTDTQKWCSRLANLCINLHYHFISIKRCFIKNKPGIFSLDVLEIEIAKKLVRKNGVAYVVIGEERYRNDFESIGAIFVSLEGNEASAEIEDKIREEVLLNVEEEKTMAKNSNML